jgi:glycosyltransferase involved in cell wall biosynthesis
MKKPINIYTLWPPNTTASFYYRLGVPLSTAEALGLPVKAIIDQNLADIPHEERIRHFCEADIVLLYQPVGGQPIQNIRNLQTFMPSKRDGDWKWPPSTIIETDDNLFNVSPMNNAFKSLGVRDMNGKPIPLGHKIGLMNRGEQKILWEDGVNGFSLLKNRHTLDTWKTLLGMVDAVTCSTQGVADEILKEVTPQRLRVFPNLVRMDHYEQVDLREEPGKIKILWQGGSAHYEDWHPLRESMGRVTAKYPEVHWIIWGAQFPWVKELMPAHRYTYRPWCHYHEYKLRLVTIGHDISIAPLQENLFNRCRSAIKFYEASVLKKPAATLAQRAGAYKNEIIDGETALLFDDPDQFEEKLSLLIENEVERKRLAANAKDWVNENANAMREVPKIVQFWEEMREDRKREQPHVSEAQWKELEDQMKAEEAAEEEARKAQEMQPA